MARALQVLTLLALALPVAGPAAASAFRDCVSGLGERARAAGVDGDLVARVLPTLSPLERVIALDRNQAEFVQTFPAYLEKRVTASRVEKGRELLERHGPFLEGLLRRYGVPPRYLVAFWGLETNYGSYLGQVPTLDSLATLACDERRSEFFAGEFVDALQLVQREALPVEQLVGSWAGAVGHTQFMPSSYLRYAVDGDGDGRIDLWQSERDALASGANFLRSLGWEPGLRWGREVRLPEGFAYEAAGLGKARKLAAWAGAGVSRADGAPLPTPRRRGVPAPAGGPSRPRVSCLRQLPRGHALECLPVLCPRRGPARRPARRRATVAAGGRAGGAAAQDGYRRRPGGPEHPGTGGRYGRRYRRQPHPGSAAGIPAGRGAARRWLPGP